MENNHNFIQYFDPNIVIFSDEYSNFLQKFDAGSDNLSFNDFIKDEAQSYVDSGDGVTYLVFNQITSTTKELVAYFTLCSGAIPYFDRWKIPEDEREENGLEYDEQMQGIPAVELKMFAVSEKYQDLFYKYEDEEKPIAAWILETIISTAYNLKNSILGVKALFLRSVPDAETFYKRNGFDYILRPMHPFYCIDNEYKAMYISFVDIHIHYDE